MKQKKGSRLSSKPKFNRVVLLFFILALAPIGYFLFLSQAAPPPPPTIYISPESSFLPINTNVTFEIRENSGTSTVNAVQANVTYPTTLFDFVSIDSSTSAFGVEAQSTGANGQITIARGVSGGSPALSGDKLVARVTLRSKTTGGAGNVTFLTGTALVSSTTNQNLLASLAVTGPAVFTVDTANPTVSVTAPTNNAVISNGTSVTVSANASDNASGIASVAIFIDGTQRTSLTAAPYNYTWNTGGVALGAHTIHARATDGVGNAVNSSTVNVTLADQTAPSVSLTAPANNSTVSGTIAINANSTDNTGGTGVSKVEFLVDNVLRATDSTSPYSFSWDSKTVSDGAHAITAKSYDNATPANVATSSVVNVTVDNADRTAPSTPGSFRTTGNTFTSIGLAWNASTDNVGVTGYRLQRGSTVLTTANVLSFNDTGLIPGQSYSYTVVALDAAGNASTAATLTASAKVLKPGDLNQDDLVDIVDLSIMLSNWNTTNATCDLNKNGLVDVYDLSILLSNYGT